ncbi:MAG: glycosyltransferase WbuB [Candidatus Nephthysia bennettiae]|nr:MAG: glycosyltransferase WbuB [Candidatus Dormibacteraeota bacterium]
MRRTGVLVKPSVVSDSSTDLSNREAGERPRRTRVLFVTPYYPPETGAPQTRVSETAVRLARAGHDVTVLTTLPNYPSGVVPEEYRQGKRRREVLQGVRVVRVWSVIRPNRGFWGRILAQLSFGCLSGLLGWRAVGRPDVIIIESPPLFDLIAGRLLAWSKRCPYILTVADIWPESAVQMGLLHARWAIWLAERLEWSSYQRAGAVWTVTEGIHAALARRGLSAGRMFVLPNGVDTARFLPADRHEARWQLGWDDRFTVLYAGTVGLAQGLEIVVEAAEQLKAHSDIRFVVLGDGAAKAELEADVRGRGLTNVAFPPGQPHVRMPTAVAAADACLVSLRGIPLFKAALPSKLYEAMACARPILLAVDGEARQLIVDAAAAGVYVEPGDAAMLARAVLALRADPGSAQQLGQRGRAFAERRFDRDRLTEILTDHITALVDRRTARQPELQPR